MGCREMICTQPGRGCKSATPRGRAWGSTLSPHEMGSLHHDDPLLTTASQARHAPQRSARHDPSVSRIVLKSPDTFWAGHNVEIIRLVPVRNDHGVVTAGNQNHIAIFDRH